MFTRVILRSGQYVLKTNNMEIDVDSFRILVEDALAIYSKASPHVENYNINLVNRRQFLWTAEFDKLGREKPDWLSEVTPVRNADIPYFSSLNTGQYDAHTNQHVEIIDPLEAPWDWDEFNKLLTVPFSSTYKIIACYRHKVTVIENDVGNYEVTTIDEYDNVFFKILQGMFLQGLGRSRRAFTMNDLPILMDADQMAGDGEKLLEDAKDELQNIQKFYLANG